MNVPLLSTRGVYGTTPNASVSRCRPASRIRCLPRSTYASFFRLLVHASSVLHLPTLLSDPRRVARRMMFLDGSRRLPGFVCSGIYG